MASEQINEVVNNKERNKDETLQPPPPPLQQSKNDDRNNSTISTKLSTDQLIFKSSSLSTSTKSIRNSNQNINREIDGEESYNYALYLGCLQFLFGMLMVGFGISVIAHDSTLAQIGGGIWGGCLVMSTGICGILAAAKNWCPLKSTPQKFAHTAFLALSLVSLAVAQLVVALAATGLGRDINISEYQAIDDDVDEDKGKISITLPANYMSIVSNIGLLVVSSIECVLAAISSYKSSRSLCPCFKTGEDLIDDLNARHRHALVSSWLGKHDPPLYVVAAPSSIGKSANSNMLSVAPVFALPPPQQRQIIGVPLIPAPLGTIPSPIIPPPSHRKYLERERRLHNKYLLAKLRSHSTNTIKRERMTPPSRRHTPTKSLKSNNKERVVTEQDVVKTYTGLDKMIAEEFIDICDSRNASLCSTSCSDSSCSRSCNGCCGDNTITEIASSRDYLVNRM